MELDYLKKYGLGTYLFFELVRRAIGLFLILGLVYGLPLALNVEGDGLANYGQSRTLFMQLSLANLNQLRQYQADGTA
jgi:hypothetical protein